MFHAKTLTPEQVVINSYPDLAERIVGKRRSHKDLNFWYIFLDDFVLPNFVVNPTTGSIEQILQGEAPCECLARAERKAAA